MVISDGFPGSWDDDTWMDHVSTFTSIAQTHLGVRDPLPVARIGLAMCASLPVELEPQLVDHWPRVEGDALTVLSLQTTGRCDGLHTFFEPAVLRYAKERAIERVQCVVPVAIENAKNYELFTRMQLVLTNEVPSRVTKTLIDLEFRPTSLRYDPIGIEIGWVWQNPFR